MVNKVLVVAYYFPPAGLSGVQRTVKFVKYLPQSDWLPIILTTENDTYHAYDTSMLAEIPQDVEIYRTKQTDITRFLPKKKPPGDGGSNTSKKSSREYFPSRSFQKITHAVSQSIFQPDNRILWKKSAMELGRQICEEHDISVIYATAPPFTDFIVGAELSLELNIPLVIDYRDAWIDNPFHFYATPLHKAYSVALEKKVLRQASRIIVTTLSTKERLLGRYSFLDNDDVLVIPHGYDNEDFIPFQDVRPSPQHCTFTHSGVFQDNRTPEYFLQALQRFLNENSDAHKHIQARFIGILRKKEERLIRKLNLQTNTLCTGYVEHGDVIRHLMESDVLWFMLFDKVRSPGKLFEYFGARKPIIASVPEGVMRTTALHTKATFATDPDDIQQIQQAISTYYSQWRNGRLPIPDENYIITFERKHLTAKLARELYFAIGEE
jgi:glycosyltransferase involved in cell wall biosynthesis